MNRLRVLLVDDEIMIREGFKKLFNWEEHDCQVIDEAADGAQALNKIDSLVPDLVIMDINLPLINGLKVIQQARQDIQTWLSLLYPAMMILPGAEKLCVCRLPIIF